MLYGCCSIIVGLLSKFVTLLPRNKLAPDSGYSRLLDDWWVRRARQGSYFLGLKIRAQNDDEPPMITGVTSDNDIISPHPQFT